MKTICLLLVRAYQVLLGPLLGGSCRYYPSCSHYAVEAIERFGAGRGSWLALRRLLRCHPFAQGGVDLVPEERESQRETPSGKEFAAGNASATAANREHGVEEFVR